jgi:hypothetical protein
MSSILSGSISLTRFKITGELDDSAILFGLQSNLHVDITNRAEELSTGFTNFFDLTDVKFDTIEKVKIDNYIVVGIRQDRRKIPAAFFGIEVNKAYEVYLSNNTHMKFVPKAEKEAIRDIVRTRILPGIPPAPSFCQLVWDTVNGDVFVNSQSRAVLDTVVGLFHQAFPGLRLSLETPFKRVCSFVPMAEHTNAQTDSVLEDLEANSGYFSDMLGWLLYRTLNTDCNYNISVLTHGPSLGVQQFSAYVDNRIVLAGNGTEGMQKVVVSGAQDQFQEAKAALRQGKQIVEAGVGIGAWEEITTMTLGAERMMLKSAKVITPAPDCDPNDDPQVERIAQFVVRMGAIAEAQQMLDSLMIEFMALRTNDVNWNLYRGKQQVWINQ